MVFNVWVIIFPVPLLPPETLFCIKFQLKLVLGIDPIKLMAVVFPEQIEFEAAVAINVGLGVTKTVTIKGVPEQLLFTGVIVYWTFPTKVPVAVNTCEITFPEPEESPVTSVAVVVQLKVVPEIELDNEIPVDCKEQIVSVFGVAITIGIWVITTCIVVVVAHSPGFGVNV